MGEVELSLTKPGVCGCDLVILHLDFLLEAVSDLAQFLKCCLRLLSGRLLRGKHVLTLFQLLRNGNNLGFLSSRC